MRAIFLSLSLVFAPVAFVQAAPIPTALVSHPAVMTTYQRFLDELDRCQKAGEGMIARDFDRIGKAVLYAAEQHQFQFRKGPEKTPYIIHPIQVAHHLMTVGHVRDPDIIIAALLHDVVEDTDGTFEQIRALFGPRVEGFVREVTDDRSLPKEERKRLQIVNAPKKSAGGAMIKLADKYCNLQDLLKQDDEKWKAKYIAWAEQVLAALPWVNAPLKKSVDDTIATYYDSVSLH